MKKRIFVAIGICVPLYLVLQYYTGHAGIPTGELVDPDCYMRLTRVLQLAEGGSWYDPMIHGSNAPYGETLHWTRPLDILLYLGALIGTPMAGFKTALFHWGVIISPTLMLISFFTLAWSTATILGSVGSKIASALFVVQWGTLTTYLTGRPDHHSVLAAMYVAFLGCGLRLVMGNLDKSFCSLAGVVGAAALWVHIEFLLAIIALAFALFLLWVVKGLDFMKKLLIFSISLGICVGILLFVERPWHDVLRVEFDRISVFHVWLLNLLTFFALFIYWIDHYFPDCFTSRRSRLLSALSVAVLMAISIKCAFPRFYGGPYVDVDPRILSIWLNKVIEVQSFSDISYLTPMTQLISYLLIGLFVFMVNLKKMSENWDGWFYVWTAFMIFMPAGFLERRLLIYAQIISVIPVAWFILWLMEREKKARKDFFKKILIFLATVFIGGGNLLAGQTICNQLSPGAAVEQWDKALIHRFSDYLNSHPQLDAGNMRILAFLDYGPELLFRTSAEVIGTPYHRNWQGIIDSYSIMTASREEESLRLIKDRNITFILISDSPSESYYYEQENNEETLYKRLWKEDEIRWLQPVTLPASVERNLKLFKVIG